MNILERIAHGDDPQGTAPVDVKSEQLCSILKASKPLGR